MRRNWLRIALVALVLAAASALPAAALGATSHVFQVDPPVYQVEDLGTLPGDSSSVAMGINESGEVVGWSIGPSGTRAFLFTDEDGMTLLPGPAGRPVAFAKSISDTGFVVGTASTGGSDIGHAVRWQSGAPLDLGTLGTGLFSQGRGVNDAGVAVGSSYTNGGNLLGVHAFRFDDTSGLVDLTPGFDSANAEAVNDAGQVAGWRNSRAFRLTGTTYIDLGIPAGFAFSFGSAINNSGQVAGHVRNATGNSERIFRYTDGSGLVILGGVGSFNRSFGINDAGDVVGEGRAIAGLQQGFVFTDADGMRGLNSLIDPGAGWFVSSAGDINNAGQVAATASGAQGFRAVRLNPGAVVEEPPLAPSGLSATVLSPTSVRLNWTDNSSNETGFNVQRALGPRGPFVQLAQIGENVNSYTDNTVRARRLYRYRVQAFNDAGPSAWSNTIRVRPG